MAPIADIGFCLNFGDSVCDECFESVRRRIDPVDDDSGIDPIDRLSYFMQ